MKKIIAAAALALTATTASAAVDFQTVAKVPGKSVTQIKDGIVSSSWSGTHTKFRETSKAIFVDALITCPGKGFWAPKTTLESEVKFDIKNGKFRVTVSNSVFKDNVAIELRHHKKGESFMGVTQKKDGPIYVQCQKAFNQMVTDIQSDVKNNSSDW